MTSAPNVINGGIFYIVSQHMGISKEIKLKNISLVCQSSDAAILQAVKKIKEGRKY